MVFKNTNNGLWFYRSPLATISQKVDMLHSNILETIEEIKFSVNIKDKK
jgi:hypothetical protein